MRLVSLGVARQETLQNYGIIPTRNGNSLSIPYETPTSHRLQERSWNSDRAWGCYIATIELTNNLPKGATGKIPQNGADIRAKNLDASVFCVSYTAENG